MIPGEFEITYPGERVSVPEARAILRPFLESAFHAGMSAFEFYHDVVAKTSVTMTTHDYYSWANNLYDHLDKATAPLAAPHSDPFLITQLPQEQISIPDRFWAKVEYTETLPSGETQTGYFTYGFGEKQSIDDLEAAASEYATGAYGAADIEIGDVHVTELYKQW